MHYILNKTQYHSLNYHICITLTMIWCSLGFIHILTSQIPGLSRTFQCQIQGPFQWIHELLMRKETPIFRKKCQNSRTFKDLYKHSRAFQAWNPNVQMPGLSRFSRTCANPVLQLISHISCYYTEYRWCRLCPKFANNGFSTFIASADLKLKIT